EISITVSKMEAHLQRFLTEYQSLLPKVDEILAYVSNIDGKLDHLPGMIREMLHEALKNSTSGQVIPDFTLSGRYQKLMDEIAVLIKEESEIKLEIEDRRIELEEAPEEKKDRLKRMLHRTEVKFIELAGQRQQTENELQDFISNVLKLAEQFSQQKGPTTPRLEKARELFDQGKYEEVDAVLNEKDIYEDIKAHEEKAQELANELMVKARAIVINKKEGWFELADKYYGEAARLHKSYLSYFKYAYFL